jgi:hypothetical protein
MVTSAIKTVIDTINKECKNLCEGLLILTNGNLPRNVYRNIGENNALNRFDDLEYVNVVHWFNVFWLFLEIKFELGSTSKKRKIETFPHISLSVFQGKETEEKQQLFRAEWDDYNNSEEKHPQPHWHITSNQAIEKTLKEYANDFEEYDFISLLEQEKEKIIDVKRIHFAMNGNWHNNGCHTHKIDNEQQIVKWLQGVLSHLRTELETDSNLFG